LAGAQVAMVSMRADGRVVAMVGGRSYRESPFNRVTQAKRQPGSTFKIFVYLAALRAGFTPAHRIPDQPIRIGNWTPQNYENKYRGIITLREAFAVSSNVAAVRLAEAVGRDRVIKAARDLGVTSELEQGPTLPLGTSTISLMEMAGAFAAVANGSYPVRPRGLPEAGDESPGTPFQGSTRRQMMELLWAVTSQGTGRGAALPIPTFGKTGTTQDSRDAYFVGFAGDLVTAVWIGRDDNKPVGDVKGGGLPAQIWRSFMAEAVKSTPAAAAPQAAASGEILPPVEGAAPPAESYPIADYDVEGSAAPAPTDAYEDLAPADPAPTSEPPVIDAAPPEAARPVAIIPRPRPRENADPPGASAPRPRDNAPAPPPREIPTVTPPPPPPAPEEEAPPDEEGEPGT
nr:penicillin-binding transpeptidase domain-containing protein [Pseudomonadota bacterium]